MFIPFSPLAFNISRLCGNDIGSAGTTLCPTTSTCSFNPDSSWRGSSTMLAWLSSGGMISCTEISGGWMVSIWLCSACWCWFMLRVFWCWLFLPGGSVLQRLEADDDERAVSPFKSLYIHEYSQLRLTHEEHGVLASHRFFDVLQGIQAFTARWRSSIRTRGRGIVSRVLSLRLSQADEYAGWFPTSRLCFRTLADQESLYEHMQAIAHETRQVTDKSLIFPISCRTVLLILCLW